MTIRAYRPEDNPAIIELSRACVRGEADFVLNPLWETEEDLVAEFARFGIDPVEHVLVADRGDDGDVQGLVGFLRTPGAATAGMLCPIVRRDERGNGVGGELLRAAQKRATEELGIQLATAGIGTRNRAGYALLTSHGFRPMRQAFVMKCERVSGGSDGVADGIEIELAKPDDNEAILALYHASGFEPRRSEHMNRLIEDGRHVHAVARKGDDVVGFVELETHWPKRPWVAFVGVSKELRAQGMGTALVAWTLARQFEAGAEYALLALSPANRTALRAYEKVGFRRFRLIDVLEKPL